MQFVVQDSDGTYLRGNEGGYTDDIQLARLFSTKEIIHAPRLLGKEMYAERYEAIPVRAQMEVRYVNVVTPITE